MTLPKTRTPVVCIHPSFDDFEQFAEIVERNVLVINFNWFLDAHCAQRFAVPSHGRRVLSRNSMAHNDVDIEAAFAIIASLKSVLDFVVVKLLGCGCNGAVFEVS